MLYRDPYAWWSSLGAVHHQWLLLVVFLCLLNSFIITFRWWRGSSDGLGLVVFLQTWANIHSPVSMAMVICNVIIVELRWVVYLQTTWALVQVLLGFVASLIICFCRRFCFLEDVGGVCFICWCWIFLKQMTKYRNKILANMLGRPDWVQTGVESHCKRFWWGQLCQDFRSN